MLVCWILLISAILLDADSLPGCHPISTTTKYQDALFVFVYDRTSDASISDAKRYIFKQISCHIPRADNLVFYVLEYAKMQGRTVSETGFVDSDGAADELETAYKTGSEDPLPCERYNKTIHEFKNYEKVKNHKNIKYIMFFQTSSACLNNLVVAEENRHIIFYHKPAEFLLLDKNGILKIDRSAKNATDGLVKFVDRIIAKNLIAIQEPVTSTAIPRKEEEKTKEVETPIETWIFGSFDVILFCALLASTIFIFLKKRKMKPNLQSSKKTSSFSKK
ncbi:unnamed protein product [Caenorhabditis angaria]|uniref:Thioredoxin domain-containing protein n=1 Tax=Caenorhabditis angaria TaxID=860376 RepID=A0A9P1N3X6_9PELO|nr:unnamed protein product [Caenorhabditis angaria]